MIKVGITGGIGSGKTTFCKEWEKLGVYVLYADDFAKNLMQDDEELRGKIKHAFGEAAYQPDGKLNRSYLATEAFEKGRVEELNALVHPVLWKRVEDLAEQKAKEGVEIFAKEAAILLNNGRPEHLDYVILLLSDEEKRTQRVMKRDNAEKEQILSRIEKQPDFESLTHLSDFIVLNDGTLEELKKKADEILNLIKEID
ncbi:MAG: dephospho-CoA kinase [Balneolaceae bacterium]